MSIEAFVKNTQGLGVAIGGDHQISTLAPKEKKYK